MQRCRPFPYRTGYPLHLALLKASPGFFHSHPREARSCLALIEDEQFLVDTAVNGGICRGACYPWTVIPGWKADLYNDALEKACTTGDIYHLAHLVAESIYRKDITVDSEEPED